MLSSTGGARAKNEQRAAKQDARDFRRRMLLGIAIACLVIELILLAAMFTDSYTSPVSSESLLQAMLALMLCVTVIWAYIYCS